MFMYNDVLLRVRDAGVGGSNPLAPTSITPAVHHQASTSITLSFPLRGELQPGEQQPALGEPLLQGFLDLARQGVAAVVFFKFDHRVLDMLIDVADHLRRIQCIRHLAHPLSCPKCRARSGSLSRPCLVSTTHVREEHPYGIVSGPKIMVNK